MDRKDERRDRFNRKKKYNKIENSFKLKNIKRKDNKIKETTE
jgi:hypothetical protein|tara:strand:- start:341 stop:466 length:126 start_codon:yes stop_codon:yes gene_type:complete